MNYTRIIKAFIIFRDEPGGPAAFFNQLSEFTQIFGSTIYIAQTIVGDSVVVSHDCASLFFSHLDLRPLTAVQVLYRLAEAMGSHRLPILAAPRQHWYV